MAVSIKFDVIRKARVVNNVQGLQIERNCYVTGLPMSAGESDPSILLKCLSLSSPRFPQIGDSHPDPLYADAFVVEQQINSIDRFKDSVDCTIIYRKIKTIDSDGSGGIFFTITHQTQTSSVQTGMTADGALPIEVWYKSGEHGVNSPPTDAHTFKTTVQKIKCTEILRASGVATKDQWDNVKADIRAARGYVNQDYWGGYSPAYWLFLGPSTRTLDSAGLSLFIQLDFAGDEDLWYRLAAFRNEFGQIPKDIDSESTLRGNGLLGDGGMAEANGVTWVSVQHETSFSPLFGFTPDD